MLNSYYHVITIDVISRYKETWIEYYYYYYGICNIIVGYNYDKKYYCCMSIACDFEVNWWFKYLRLP